MKLRRSVLIGLVAVAMLSYQMAALTQAANPLAAEEVDARAELLRAAYAWRRATLAGDFDTQSSFYPQRMDAFYLWRDVPKASVMAEKRRVFERAKKVEIEIEVPQVLIDPGARSARMYFRKMYDIVGNVNRSGEVLQELRWVKQPEGWKIVSERDIRVVRQARRT